MGACKEWTLFVVPTSQGTQFVSILKSKQLMTFTEIIDVYFENWYHINTVFVTDCKIS
jgi:hypothetical protein